MKYKVENQCYFNDIISHIKKELQAATQSIKICIAWINLSNIEDILLEKISSGIDVKIVCNFDSTNIKTIKKSMLENSNIITTIRNPIRGSLMHHKFCIIDDATLITGSFNWSYNAAYHYENIVIIKNDFKLIRKYKNEFADLHFMGNMSYSTFHSHKITKNTSSFNLGTYSSSSGLQELVRLDVWQVSLQPTKKATLVDTQYIPHFFLSVEINSDHHNTMDEKEIEIDLYNKERQQIEQIQNHFKNSYVQIHAYGTAVIANADMHIEYSEPPEREISLNWIDMRFKKVLPSSFEADGDFERIWDEIYYPD